MIISTVFRLPPLLLPLCSYMCGIAAAGSLNFFLPRHLLLLLIASLAPLFIFRIQAVLTTNFLVILFVLGNLCMQPSLQADHLITTTLEQNHKQKFHIEGIIANRPEARNSGYRVTIRPETVKASDTGEVIPWSNGLLLLRVESGGGDLLTGERIRFVGKLKLPRNFGTIGEFDIERYYRLKGIVATSFAKNDSDITTLGHGDKETLQRHFDMTAAEIGRFIMKELPGVEGGVMKALLIGDTSSIPQTIKDQYSRTGVNHILSISGFHVGIIALALFHLWFAISRLFPATLLYFNFRRFAILCSIPLISYYMFLSGAAPATARSVIMLSTFAIGLLLERDTDPVNTLSLAAFALLLFNPANLYDISFQLSFLALWGLIIVTPILTKPFKTENSGWKYNLALFSAASIAAVTVTILPVAYYFQQISLTGIISNFFIVPLLGYGAVIAGFTALPFIWLSPIIASWLLSFAALLTTLSNQIITLLAKVPTPPLFIPTEAEIAIFLCGMLMVTVIRDFTAKTVNLLAVPLIITMLHQTAAQKDETSLRIDFLSVGQGESTLISFPGGKKMLIDGGGALHDTGWDIGRQLLLPSLMKMGVRKIDYLVLTHDHPDHLQGVKAVAEVLPVGEFWESGMNHGAEYWNLRRTLELKGIPSMILNSSTTETEISGTKIKCLYPVKGITPPMDMNETSLTLHLTSGNLALLFTGDIGFEAENILIKGKYPLKSAILKVPHHGSRFSTSPDFLDAVSPQTALISAGFNNNFNLPSSETLQQLADKGIRTYRTDLDGTITVKLPANGKEPETSVFKRQIR